MASCVVCSAEIRDDARFCPSCGAEQPKTTAEGDDPFIGQTIARNFKIEKLLGVGGMGKVYKARQLSLDKAVVIKVLHDHFRDDPQLVQRFQREARAASRLNHPNSIQVIDFGQDESGVLFMAIEFLNGTDLFTVLQKEGPFGEERISRVMVQTCSALGEAHEMNVIHRDLKPENIMIEDRRGRRDVVKVLDFGIAKIQDPDETPGQALTQAGMVCGTPEYMSPEQARGHQLDHRSDLYSLGVLVYQMTTGELPFQADSPIGIVTKHIIEQPTPPTEKYPQLNMSKDLEAVILRSMAKDPSERYQTAAEMGAAFETLLRRFGALTGEIALSQTGARPVPGSTSQPASPAPPAVTEDAVVAVAPAAPTVDAPAAPVGGTLVGLAGPGTNTEQPPVRKATLTAPTPTGLTPVQIDSGSGGRGKMAAMAAMVALLVGGIAVFVLKDTIFPPAAVTAAGDGDGTEQPETGNPETANPDGTVKDTPLGDEGAVAATGNGEEKGADPSGVKKGEPDGDKGGSAGTVDDKGATTKGKTATATQKANDDDANAGKGQKGSEDGSAAGTSKGTKTAKDDDGAKATGKGGSSKDTKRTRKPKGDDSNGADGKGRTRVAKAGTDGDSPSPKRRAKAKSLVREAQSVIFAEPDRAYKLLKQAMRTDSSYYESRKLIAMYWARKGNDVKACNAMKDYIKFKGSSLSGGARRNLLKLGKCG